MGMSIKSKTGFETDLRMLICESWVAVYRIEDESGMISVARIMDARQDYMRILFGEVEPVPTIEENEDKDYQPGPAMTK